VADADTNVLRGGAGNDNYYVGNTFDKVVEAVGDGTDIIYTVAPFALGTGQEIERLQVFNQATTNATTLRGNEFGQFIVGNAGQNTLDGGAGNDIIIANAGQDTINGGADHDTITGGADNDFYIFNSPLGPGQFDTITDFNHAADTIRLENSVFTALTATGQLGANAFFLGAAAHDADDRIIYNQGAVALYYDSDGLGGATQTLFAVLSSHPANVANSDFFVI
jgi:Ca2+-binding RTX toxin-like protein